VDLGRERDTPYDRLGGEAGVRRLVGRFYDLMDELPEARPIREMHPADLGSSREKLALFLCGFLGGPPLYVERFGHPRLRARHLPFSIGAAERDQWMLCMGRALEELVSDSLLRMQLEQNFARVADHMRNQPDGA
jgi:hemoglobin